MSVPTTSSRRPPSRYRLARAAPRTAHGFRSTWTDVDGLRIHARTPSAPPPGAPTVVLVHGLAVSHRYLMPLAAALAPDHDVRVVDLPGFGLTYDPGRVLTVAEQSAALGAWLRTERVDRVVLLGHSYGAQVVTHLAAHDPGLVRALVLAGPTMDLAARTAPRQIARWLRDTLREPPAQLPLMLADLRDAGPRRIALTLRDALADPVEDHLAAVAVPTLVVRGSRDPIVPQAWAERARALVPGAASAEVRGAPHNCVYTDPEACAATIRAFLQKSAGVERVADDGGTAGRPVQV